MSDFVLLGHEYAPATISVAPAGSNVAEAVTPDSLSGEGVNESAEPRRTVFGVTLPIFLGGLLLILVALWGVWTTRELLALRRQKIVSVSLATLVREFIAVEARSGVTQDQAAARTSAYIQAAQGAVQSLHDQGYTVLVSEAVVGNSVPDMTGAVSAAVDARLKSLGSPAPAPVPVAVP